MRFTILTTLALSFSFTTTILATPIKAGTTTSTVHVHATSAGAATDDAIIEPRVEDPCEHGCHPETVAQVEYSPNCWGC